jgi:hypothetical protein
MNHNPVFIIIFLMAGTLLTSVVSIVPGDKDYGDSNKQKVEDGSAGETDDCDNNEFERAEKNCIAITEPEPETSTLSNQ